MCNIKLSVLKNHKTFSIVLSIFIVNNDKDKDKIYSLRKIMIMIISKETIAV